MEKLVLDKEIHNQKPKVKKSSVVRFTISKERAGKSRKGKGKGIEKNINAFPASKKHNMNLHSLGISVANFPVRCS